ncbi:MAG: hypothetical protein Q8R12_03745 [bacterium]|nr:hypothetical protein [bacterium]
MALYFYLGVFIVSSLAAGIIFMRRFSGVREFSSEELSSALTASPSVRAEFSERYLIPLRDNFYEHYLPAFWRWADKMVRRARVLVLKLETKLARLSETLRGRHINLEVEEKSEYWQSLNGAKNNKNKEEKPE